MTREPHTWRGWYFVPATNLAQALREARERAHADHPDTPIGNMMTPHVREASYMDGWRIMVIGKPISLR